MYQYWFASETCVGKCMCDSHSSGCHGMNRLLRDEICRLSPRTFVQSELDTDVPILLTQERQLSVCALPPWEPAHLHDHRCLYRQIFLELISREGIIGGCMILVIISSHSQA